MIESLQIKNFTVFTAAALEFGKNLDVIVGRLPKLAYSV